MAIPSDYELLFEETATAIDDGGDHYATLAYKDLVNYPDIYLEITAHGETRE